MNQRRFFICVPFLTAVALGSGEDTNKNSSPLAEIEKSSEVIKKILTEVASVYEKAESYVDEGVTTTITINGEDERTTLKPFSTAFSRSDRLFRFEFRARNDDVSWGSYIVAAKGDDVQKWWYIKPQIEHPASLQLAIGSAVGVSDGSAMWVPQLLMPNNAQGWIMLHTKESKLLPEREIDGVKCVGISGLDLMGDPLTFWFETDRKLIRRIEQEHKFPDFRTKTTITYKPDINVEIPKEKFELNIPANGGK